MANNPFFNFFSILTLTSVVTAQGIYYEGSGFAAAGPDNHDQEILFENAARSPLHTNNVSFPGFDFSLTPSASSPQNLELSSNWTLHLNYSVVDVTNETLTPGNNKTQLMAQLVYDLAFPNDEPLPAQNDTDWTMCGHFLTSPIPAELESRFASETGDCSATLGADCLAAYRASILASPTTGPGNATCPGDLFWSGIPECPELDGKRFELVSAPLMNYIPEAYRAEGVNYNGTYNGLNSTQAMLYQVGGNRDEGSEDLKTSEEELSRGMRMIILSFQPSRAYVESGGEGAMNRDVRFICGRADVNAASSFSIPWSLWILCGMVTATIVRL